MFYGIINWNCIVTNERNVLKMREYGEEKAKRELEELLQIIPIKIKKNQKKLKKVVDIWEGWCYYNQVAAIRQRQKLKETQQITEFFKN